MVETARGSAGGPAEHLHWIDALKVLVVVGIAFFHAFLVFSGRPWLVTNREPDVVMAAFDGFVYQWGMALMFALAGSATFFALRSRRAVAFLRLRWRKLGVPFVAALAVLSPLQAYVSGGGGPDLGALLASYPRWVASLRLTWHLSSTAGFTYHLWFLVFLLLISTIALPLLAWLRAPGSRRLREALARRSSGRFGFLLLAAPIALVAAVVQPAFPAYEDWGDLLRFGAVFTVGYLVVTDPRFVEGLRRQGRTSLWIAIALSAGLGLLAPLNILGGLEAHPGYRPDYVAYTIVRAFNTWAWVTVFLSLGVRVLDRDNASFRHLSELSLPFYILHHPVLVLIAAPVVTLPWSPWPKVALILAGTLTITFALCEVVARSAALRSLFGLHALPPSVPRVQPSAGVAG